MLLLHSRHELHDKEMSIDVEVAMPLPNALPGNEQIRIRRLPSGSMAFTVHTGDDLSIGRAYVALYRWMTDNGYRLNSSPRLVHLQRAEYMDPSHYVTEVQFPVAKQEG
jgi:effector-binding domain-containing protein